jgi:hypothetical protein
VDLVEAIRRVAELVERLPEAYEQDAWVGVRWRIRAHTIAHVRPLPAHAADAVGVTFRAAVQDADLYAGLGGPWFKPDWSPTVAGLVLTDATDWSEVAELLTDSYCLMAPKKLARQLQARIAGPPSALTRPRLS